MSGNPWYQLRASSLTFLGPDDHTPGASRKLVMQVTACFSASA